MFLNTPPCSSRESSSSPHIHNYIAHGEKCLMTQRLSEKVGQVIRCAHEGNDQGKVLHLLSYEEMAALHVFRTWVVLRIICEVAACLVIHRQGGWFLAGDTYLLKEPT